MLTSSQRPRHGLDDDDDGGSGGGSGGGGNDVSRHEGARLGNLARQSVSSQSNSRLYTHHRVR